MSSLGNAANLHLVRGSLYVSNSTHIPWCNILALLQRIRMRLLYPLRGMFNMFHVSISTHIPWCNMLAAFLHCMCMPFTISMKVISPLSPPRRHPTISTYLWDNGILSATQTWNGTSVSKSDLECGFWSRQEHIQATCKTWRSAFDWLNIVSRSSNNGHNNEIQWRLENDMDCRLKPAKHLQVNMWCVPSDHSCRTCRLFHWSTNVNDGKSIPVGTVLKAKNEIQFIFLLVFALNLPGPPQTSNFSLFKVPWLQGSKNSKVPKVSKFQKYQSSRVPRFQGSSGPRFQGSWVPAFLGSRVPRFQGSVVPGFQGSKVLGFGVPSRDWNPTGPAVGN